MSLLAIIVVLVICGVLLWAIESCVPMSPPIKRLLQVVVVIVLLLWVLQGTGILGPIGNVRIK